jgi:hypothetical protein
METPEVLEGCKWKQLFKAFIRSDNFWPWYNKKRSEIVSQWAEIHRILRLNTDNKSLIAACEDEESKVALYMRIKKAIETHKCVVEGKAYIKKDTDDALMLKMKEHLTFLASDLEPQSIKLLVEIKRL